MNCVSIIVPVYKTDPNYLKECIESLIHQTHENIEIILVDDGSPDSCGKICDRYAAKDARIKVIHQENQGVSVARNNGIDAAAGEYIMFVDADDWMEEECVETVLNEAVHHSAELLLFQHVIEYRRKRYFPPKITEGVADKQELKNVQLCLLRNGRFYQGFDQRTVWGKIIKKECLTQNIRFTKGLSMAQDMVFNLLLLEHVSSAYKINYVGYHYRMVGESSTHRYKPWAPSIAFGVMSEFDRFIRSYHEDDSDYIKALGEGSMNLIAIIEKSYTFHVECRLSRKEIVDVTRNYLEHPLIKKYSSQYCIRDCKSIKGIVRYLLQSEKNLTMYYIAVKIVSKYIWRL